MENFEKCTVAMLGGPCSQHVTGNTSRQNHPQSAIIPVSKDFMTPFSKVNTHHIFPENQNNALYIWRWTLWIREQRPILQTVFELIIQIITNKKYIAFMWKMMIKSDHNFAHAMTTQLSWHVHNRDLIGSLKENKYLQYFDFSLQTFCAICHRIPVSIAIHQSIPVIPCPATLFYTYSLSTISQNFPSVFISGCCVWNVDTHKIQP